MPFPIKNVEIRPQAGDALFELNKPGCRVSLRANTKAAEVRAQGLEPAPWVLTAWMGSRYRFEAASARYAVHNWLREVAGVAEPLSLSLEALIAECAKHAGPQKLPEVVDTRPHGICQICGKRHVTKARGRLPHHGYTRPGHGVQTKSCPGALHLPFEDTREYLGLHIEECHLERRNSLDHLEMLKLGSVRVPGERVERAEWARYTSAEKAWMRASKRGEAFYRYHRPAIGQEHPEFAKYQAEAIQKQETECAGIAAYIEHQTERFEKWAPQPRQPKRPKDQAEA